jgi:hypothetical protein
VIGSIGAIVTPHLFYSKRIMVVVLLMNERVAYPLWHIDQSRQVAERYRREPAFGNLAILLSYAVWDRVASHQRCPVEHPAMVTG